MGGRLHRERLRANGRKLMERYRSKTAKPCINCGQIGRHYVPVSRWEGYPDNVTGIWICNDEITPIIDDREEKWLSMMKTREIENNT